MCPARSTLTNNKMPRNLVVTGLCEWSGRTGFLRIACGEAQARATCWHAADPSEQSPGLSGWAATCQQFCDFNPGLLSVQIAKGPLRRPFAIWSGRTGFLRITSGAAQARANGWHGPSPEDATSSGAFWGPTCQPFSGFNPGHFLLQEKWPP